MSDDHNSIDTDHEESREIDRLLSRIEELESQLAAAKANEAAQVKPTEPRKRKPKVEFYPLLETAESV